ncbi:MAG: RNA methyltransferase [Saprospiraceae bacterium]|nr:RNA methyltransferase [Saprospiraceae bacterium]
MTLSKAKLKYLLSLKTNKIRQKYGVFVVEGDKMAQEVLTHKGIQIDVICGLESWIQQYHFLLKPNLHTVITVSEAELKQISNLTTPNKVLIVAHVIPPQYDEALIQHSFSLYLDGIQDPGNMGTILRIADWFSMPYVFCAKTCVDVWQPKVVQASMGAFLRVKTLTVDFADLVARFPHLPTFAAVLRGQNIFEMQGFPPKGLIIIGNEGNGISEAVIEQAQYKITIPGGGGAESLNAAVSTGIIAATLTQRR